LPNGVWTTTGSGKVTKNLNFGLPRSGKWYATTGGLGAANNGTISQAGVTVPNTATAMLRAYLLISVASTADGTTQDTTGTIDITFDPDGANPPVNVGHWDQTYANNTYIRYDLEMGALGLNGVTGTLTISAHEDNPNFQGGYFLGIYDDFTLTPR
jgi:hypothetical protein